MLDNWRRQILTDAALQVVHKEQYDDKRQVLQEATTVDDMYDMLAVYEQKVVTADQVRASV